MSDSSPILQVKNLIKDFGKGPVLNGISLDVNKGDVIVFIGPSGCGKSTFLRCLNGLELIQGGDIIFNGRNLTSGKTDWTQIRQEIGMVFQSYELFPHQTVMQNITLGPIKVQHRKAAEVEQEAEALLDRIGLLDKKDAYPRQLSGGQKQRVAIVRALIMHPKILLFDEVTASLDPETVREVLDVMLELARAGSTMLIVTHEMQFAEAVADRVIFMDQGQIIEQGTAHAFFNHPQTERVQHFLNTFSFEEEKGNHK